MNAKVQKEIRCIAVYTAATITVALIASWTLLPSEHRLLNNALVLFAVFTALVGSSSFGTEISLGTLCGTLTQPESRDAVWQRKMIVLAVALAIATIIFSTAAVAIAFGFETGRTTTYLLFFSLPAITAWGIAPWLTLVTGDSIVAAGATVLIEWGVFLAIRFTHTRIPDPAMPIDIYMEFVIGFTLLGLIGWLFGKVRFRSLEIVDASMPRRRLFVLGVNGLSARTPGRSAAVSLIVKELRLQRASLVMASVVLIALQFSLWHPIPKPGGLKQLLDFYLMVFPIVVGATTVASERQLSILDWHLALPASARAQWLIKILVAYSVSVGLGVIMPWTFVALRTVINPLATHDWFSIGRHVPVTIYGTAMTILASAQTRGPLRAAVAGMTAVITSILLSMFLQPKILAMVQAQRWGQPLQNQWVGYFFRGFALVTLLLMLSSGAEYFRQPRLRLSWSASTCIAAAMMCLLICFSAALAASRI